MKGDNINVVRTEPCIGVYPSANKSGSWALWNVNTKKYVRRTHWIKPKLIIQFMINIMNKQGNKCIMIEPVEVVKPEVIGKQEKKKNGELQVN